jgi:lipase chaperone LimK
LLSEPQFKDPLLTPELRHTLEAMLFEVTGGNDMRDPALLKKRLALAVPKYFPNSLTAQATQLLERYVDYRVALSALKAPTDASDPRALRSALDARQAVRQRHFANEEYEALFAEDARLDRYTLARIEIERNSALTEAQKQAALKEADNELSDAQRAQRSQAAVHMSVAAQTTALNASNASDQERFRQRSAQYGEAAAAQLAQLDRQEADWQARLDSYASAQAKKTSPEQLQQLSQQLFSASEQLRLPTALAMRGPVAP